jgi:ribonuclease P protein subunit RPR2
MERRGRGRRSKDTEQIAQERIDILLKEAAAAVRADRKDRSKRYVDLARKIGMRYNVPLPAQGKRWVCLGCGVFMVPGRNATLRLRPQRTIIRCLDCGKIKRVGRKRRGARVRRAQA